MSLENEKESTSILMTSFSMLSITTRGVRTTDQIEYDVELLQKNAHKRWAKGMATKRTRQPRPGTNFLSQSPLHWER